ncbi:MAG: AEC family transporter [Myxococcaceae bacterium]|nr:AEC family transporter [Myxococcaceae bacterium]
MWGVVALLIVSVGLGILARRSRMFPAQTPEVLNSVILNVALPALVLRVLHDVPVTPSLFAAASMLWLQFLLSLTVFWLLARFTSLERGTAGALILTAGLSNTAYVGLPVIEAVLGHEALGVAVFVDQIGSFLVMASLGIAAAAAFSGRSAHPRTIALKVLRFPPFIALVVAFLLRPVAFPAWALTTLDRLGGLLTPLALFSVGFQLRFGEVHRRLGALGAGLLFKLAVSPLVLGLLFALFAAPASTEWKVTVLQCAMPPMVTGGILASQSELDPPLAAAMVGVGLPLSAATLAVIVHLMG